MATRLSSQSKLKFQKFEKNCSAKFNDLSFGSERVDRTFTHVSRMKKKLGSKRVKLSFAFSPPIFSSVSFIFRHNSAIQCVSYNPFTHQLASCAADDIGELSLD